MESGEVFDDHLNDPLDALPDHARRHDALDILQVEQLAHDIVFCSDERGADLHDCALLDVSEVERRKLLLDVQHVLQQGTP